MAGRSSSPKPSWHSRLLTAVAASTLLTAMVQGMPSPALSQTLNDQLGKQTNNQKSRLLVDANEIFVDRDNDIVEARGDVQLFYQGRRLEADKVVYNRKTKRVYAEGNAKLTEQNGQVIFSDRFELTDDFRDGFIDSLRVVSPDKQRISAARGERTDGETTVFDRGTYTACEPCKANPEKPPLWQVRAARIIAKNSEQLIYYEDATIEFYGLPLAYVPYFSAPDPTVSRKSGFLTPRYSRSSTNGLRVSIPYYLALAPNYDLLFTPSILSRQGLLNEVEFRHRLETGVYNIRAAGIFQADPTAFRAGPFGPNKGTFTPSTVPGGLPTLSLGPDDKRIFRGSIETTGKFLINKNFNFGWDIALTTDKFFISNYRVKSEATQFNFFKETVSSVYLRGQTDRAYFDATGYYFQGQTANDWQKQQPVVHPTIDYNRRFTPPTIGGELTIDANITSLTRDTADFVQLPPTINGVRFASSKAAPSRFLGPQPLFTALVNGVGASVYQGCQIYQRGDCLLRGVAGNVNRASTVISWRRTFIDPIGQVWTPFVSAQLDVINYSLRTGSATGGLTSLTTYGNDKQTGYLSANDTTARALPAIGLEYRYPLVVLSSFATQLFEPIAQIIAAPNEQRIGKLPNEDAQSLVFSDSNLFSLNRFSGYDRSEGGVRSNVGAQYTATFNSGAYVNALVGQSYHLGGRNSFAGSNPNSNDLLNTGLNSGLDKSRSDYVSRFSFSPTKQISFVARGRFDEESLKVKRLELSSILTTGPLTTSLLYARQDAQPDLGFVRRREGVLVANTYKFTDNWFVNSSVLFDLDRYTFDRDLVRTNQATGGATNFSSSPFRLSSYGLGVGYIDECTTFTLNYSRSVAENPGAVRTTSTTVLFRLELKHLGQLNYRQGTSATSSDGTR